MRLFKTLTQTSFRSLTNNKNDLTSAIFGSKRYYNENYSKRPGDVKFDFESSQFKMHKCKGPSLSTHCNKDEMIKYFKDMAYIRRMELVCDLYYKQKLIWGFCHLYDGQEAVCVGMEAALKPGDHIITAYRDHGFQYTRGDTIRGIFAEMFGKATGCSRGKGGSMHLYWKKGNFHGGNGIVGAQIPVGTGIALACKQKGDKSLCVTAFGDGAANQGQFFESLNMAKLWSLPVIYLVENNRYGMGTSAQRASAVHEFYTRGDYVPGIRVDGMDILAIREAARFAADHCRSGKGPIVFEASTYRYHGHSMSDPGISYRSQNEVQEIRNQYDPLRKVTKWLVENKWMSENEIKELEKEIKHSVENDAKDALNDKELKNEELVTDIYSTGPPPFVRFSDYANSIVDGKTRLKDLHPEYA